MKKAEAQEHWRDYESLVRRARDAEGGGRFGHVVKLAESSWPFVDGMLRHLQTGDATTTRRIDGIALVLKYAPLLFEFESLDRLESLLKSKRRIIKQSTDDLGEELSRARELMWLAHGLWDHIELHGRCDIPMLNRDFVGRGDDWRRIVSTWEAMEIVRCSAVDGTGLVMFSAWADELVNAKCPSCGIVIRRMKAAVYDQIECHRCKHHRVFVQVVDDPSGSK